jgi:hypothetical protein
MADQTTLRGGGGPATAHVKDNGYGDVEGTPEGRVVGGLSEFVNDITTLVELQAKLAALDVSECTAAIKWPLAAIVVGAVLALGAVPVAIFGLAEVLAAALQISHGWALVLTAGAVLLLSGAAIAVSVRGLRSGLAYFRRSREELIRNLNWIRTVILYSGRSLHRRFR